MRIIVIILWLQLALGFVGAFIAFGGMHTAAMSMEWGGTMQREFERVRKSPEYREPPPIQGYSYSRLVDGVRVDASRLGHMAFLGFVSCLAASLFAAVLLCLFHRANRSAQVNTA